MLNSAQHGQKTSIHELSMYKLWNHLLFAHLLKRLVVLALTIKFGLLSEALDFNYSDLPVDFQQSGF